MATTRWIYDTYIPINVMNSNYYQPMLNVVARGVARNFYMGGQFEVLI